MNDSDLQNLSRREAFKLSALGLSAAFAPQVFAANAKPLPLITKAVPSTSEKLPVIGMGTNAFTQEQLTILQSMIKRMSELGGSVIDTSPAYGEGDSEITVGKILSGIGERKKYFIATKLTNGGAMQMGRGAPPSATGPQPKTIYLKGGKESLDLSLERLKVDRIDLLEVHSLMGVDELMPALQEWKKAGKVRYIGMTTSNDDQHAQMLEYMKKYPIDFIQVNYSIENPDAETAILPLARERKIGVFVNLPLGGRGGRNMLANNKRELPKWAAEIDIASWSQYLLKYVISHPAVTVAIPGSVKLEHMEDNQGAARGVLPDAAMRKRMLDYWNASA